MADYESSPYRGKIREEEDGSFEADEHIIQNVSAARSQYWTLRAKHIKRINLYKEIEGLIQGNPPYSPSDLKAAGLDYIANFNDMGPRALMKMATQAYWNLLHNAEYMTNFALRLPGVPQVEEWAHIMSKNWDYAVKKHWKSFDINVASLQYQLVKLGVSPAIFPDEQDPRWRVVELSKFFVPDQQQSDLDFLTTCCVESELSIQYLWGIYKEFKDKPEDSSPWNVEELGKLLVWASATPSKDQLSPEDLVELQRRLANGDITFDRIYNDSLRMISLLQQEYDGKVSQYMFHRDYDGAEFVFKQTNQWQSISDALVLFTMSPGELTIHSNRGLGMEIFPLGQAKIQLDCQLLDGAKWSSSPVIKSPTLNTKDSDQIRFIPGVPINLGGAELVQNNLGTNLNNVIGVANYIQSLIQFNISYSGSDPGQPDRDKGSLSPTQARLQAYREFSVLKNNIAHFYGTFDHLLERMTIKMLNSKEGYAGHKIAKEWKERCLEDGVPEEVFEMGDTPDGEMPRHIEVQATRVAGAGSQVAQLMGLETLGAMIGSSFGPREAREFKRQSIIAAMGSEAVGAFLQEGDDVDERAGGASLAGVENAIMQAGKSPIFSVDNEHASHLAVHSELARQAIEMQRGGQMTPIEADSIFNVLVPHMGEHLGAVEADPYQQTTFNQYRGFYGEVAQYAALNRKNAEKQLQAQQKEQQRLQEQQGEAMSDAERKDFVALRNEQRSDIKLQAQAARQQEAGDVKAQNARRKTDADISLKAREVEGKLAIDRKKASLENTADEDAATNATQALEEMRGETIAATDIEGI